jgi:hypothetical protein
MLSATRTALQRIDSPWLRAAVAASLAGVFAGTAATIAQMLLWWLEATPVVETLLRDARLTAAIVLGRAVLAPEPTWRGDVLAAATLIHFALSLIYAAIALPVARRLRTGPAMLAGAVYGLAIYVVNLHGFTLVFPWFAVSRGAVTILTHVVFGVSLAWACACFGRPADAGLSASRLA